MGEVVWLMKKEGSEAAWWGTVVRRYGGEARKSTLLPQPSDTCWAFCLIFSREPCGLSGADFTLDKRAGM